MTEHDHLLKVVRQVDGGVYLDSQKICRMHFRTFDDVTIRKSLNSLRVATSRQPPVGNVWKPHLYGHSINLFLLHFCAQSVQII